MSDNSKIEWCNATWNPISGCTKVSPGCDHCYAERVTERFHGKGSFETVVLHPDRLDQPLRWRKPRRIFVNSMSDLFHDDVPDEFIARVFSIMALADRHTFQILTKRHARMRSLLSSARWEELLDSELLFLGQEYHSPLMDLDPARPLDNVWLGVSVEDQHWADIRIPALLDTPAAVRFLSCEPLLGPIELDPWRSGGPADTRLGWVIVGGESGPGARPMHPQWARDIRDQCVAAGVPFHFKQNGEWLPGVHTARVGDVCLSQNGTRHDVTVASVYVAPPNVGDGIWLRRVGKKTAGRELDGRTWDEYPQPLVGAS